MEGRLPELEPALGAIERSLDDELTLATLLEMDEQARWKLIRSRNQRGSQLANAAFAGASLRAELFDLQGLLATVDEELDGLGPLQPDLVDVGPEVLPAGDSPDDTPVVDEPQEESPETSTGGSGFDGAWTTRSGNRIEFTHSSSSVTGPYGRMEKHENGERTLGVIGEMDMQVTGERTLEGYWIKHSRSSVKCTVPKNGSDYWGQQLMVFDEAFMSWTGAWTYCDGSLWRDSDGIRIRKP